MRDIKRIPKILKSIETIWQSRPDSRFGQLLINLGLISDNLMVWQREDDELEEILNEILKEMDEK